MAETRDVAVVILSTASSPEEGDRLAHALVDERLAACVSQIPGVKSRYRWQGEVVEGQEVMLVIKSLASRSPEITRRLRELHSYEVPEILVVPAAAGLPAYLDWLRTETTPENPS